MALPTSGAISLSQFRTTFGGTSPDAISEYYRGGSLVSDNAINTSIPQSGAASFSDYYGGAGTQTRNLQVNMDYNLGFTGFGLTTQSSTAAPFSISTGANAIVYQPVFRAGTGFITSASIGIGQNEDTPAVSEFVLLYGGTTSSNVNNIVGRWDAGSDGSTGGRRYYALTWDADGKISAVTYTSGDYNIGIITHVTNDISGARAAGYTWFGFRLKNPSSFSGKANENMTGSFNGTANYTQPS
jgi:hypothetical protein